MGKVNNINVSSIELTNIKPNPSKGYEVRECEHQVDGEPWLMESDYYSGTTYADRRWEEKKVTDRGWHYLRICHKYVNGKVEVINSSIPEYRDLIKILGGKDDEIETGLFPYAIEALLENGEKVDANKLKKVATQFGLTNPNEIIQQAELGVVKSARKIANNGESLRVRFEKIRDIYDLQPTISPKDGRANFLQQFSTPAPIAFLAGEFVKSENKHAHYLEPSAGNGMLTIALPVENTWVNDLDDVRYKNLLTQGFSQVTNLDASTINNGRTSNTFNGVITNPPFGRLSKKDFLVRKGRKGNKEIEYTFEVLDHKLAILALESMADNGRCAIIVGGKLASKMYDHKKAFWKDDRLFGDFNVFVSYLNRQYNLIDILYISGDLYAKQGTTYPIVMLLIDGRKKWDAEPTAIWHKYDEKLDKPIESLSEYWDRMVGHIEKQETKQAPVQSSLVTFSNGRVVKNYPEDYTAKDILFKGKKIGFAIMNESKTYYIDGDKLDYILNGRYTQKGSFLKKWCYSIYDKTKEHFTKESFFCDGLRFVFSQEDDVIKFMSLFDELFIKNAQSASTDLDRKRKLLILAKAKIKIAQAKAKNNTGLSGNKDLLKRWLNPSDISYVEKLKNIDELDRIDILEKKFGNKLYAISSIPFRFLPIIGFETSDNNVYSSKAYFLNHYLHHDLTTKIDDYDKMQLVLNDPDYIVETDTKSIAFVKLGKKYKTYIVFFNNEDGKFILHKTFFLQSKKPYKNLERLFEIISEDDYSKKETPSIVHSLKGDGSIRFSALDMIWAK